MIKTIKINRENRKFGQFVKKYSNKNCLGKKITVGICTTKLANLKRNNMIN